MLIKQLLRKTQSSFELGSVARQLCSMTHKSVHKDLSQSLIIQRLAETLREGDKVLQQSFGHLIMCLTIKWEGKACGWDGSHGGFLRLTGKRGLVAVKVLFLTSPLKKQKMVATRRPWKRRTMSALSYEFIFYIPGISFWKCVLAARCLICISTTSSFHCIIHWGNWALYFFTIYDTWLLFSAN